MGADKATASQPPRSESLVFIRRLPNARRTATSPQLYRDDGLNRFRDRVRSLLNSRRTAASPRLYRDDGPNRFRDRVTRLSNCRRTAASWWLCRHDRTSWIRVRTFQSIDRDSFRVADVLQPILGADFLCHHGLLVDD